MDQDSILKAHGRPLAKLLLMRQADLFTEMAINM
jgi:hypothetical protein